MSEFEMVAAAVVMVLSVGRVARLLTYDDMPLVKPVREWLVQHSSEKWSTLWLCPFCLAPYLTAINMAWAWASDLDTLWWVANGWAAASYVAAIVVSYDQPD